MCLCGVLPEPLYPSVSNGGVRDGDLHLAQCVHVECNNSTICVQLGAYLPWILLVSQSSSHNPSRVNRDRTAQRLDARCNAAPNTSNQLRSMDASAQLETQFGAMMDAERCIRVVLRVLRRNQLRGVRYRKGNAFRARAIFTLTF